MANAAQSLVLGPDFLLLVPHPAPAAAETEGKSALEQKPVPHPLAFVGGTISCPVPRRAWFDPEDPKTLEAVVSQTQETNTHQSSLDTAAIKENILLRPLAALSMTCHKWQGPIARGGKKE